MGRWRSENPVRFSAPTLDCGADYLREATQGGMWHKVVLSPHSGDV